MTEVVKPENAPEHCPGPASENAGKGDACAGCPSRNLCSSGAARDAKSAQESAAKDVAERLGSVRNKLLILSGKGGVGKSTLTALLARALAAEDSNRNVGVLDIDICGPSQPRVLGVHEESVHQSGSGWSPVYVEDNLSVMSIGFLLGSSDDAIVWRGPKKSGMVRQFLADVDWDSLDYLLIDTPPGTSDEHLSVCGYLAKAGVTGAIIVTTPQEVALLDVRKEIDFCRKLNIRVIGVVENMTVFVCPNCKSRSEIFPAVTGGAKQMCNDLNVPLLGHLPVEPKLARSCDEGTDFLTSTANCATIEAIKHIAQGVTSQCELKNNST